MPELRQRTSSSAHRTIEVMRPKERWWQAEDRPLSRRTGRGPRGFMRSGERWWAYRDLTPGPRPTVSMFPLMGSGPFWMFWPLDPLRLS